MRIRELPGGCKKKLVWERDTRTNGSLPQVLAALYCITNFGPVTNTVNQGHSFLRQRLSEEGNRWRWGKWLGRLERGREREGKEEIVKEGGMRCSSQVLGGPSFFFLIKNRIGEKPLTNVYEVCMFPIIFLSNFIFQWRMKQRAAMTIHHISTTDHGLIISYNCCHCFLPQKSTYL